LAKLRFIRSASLTRQLLTENALSDITNKLLIILLFADGRAEWALWCKVTQWDAYRLTLRFPIRRAAVSLGG
jgi:hypothetical protein